MLRSNKTGWTGDDLSWWWQACYNEETSPHDCSLMWLSLTMSLDVTRCDIQSTCDNFPSHGVAVNVVTLFMEKNTMRARVHSKKEKKFKNRVWRVEKTFQFYHCHFITGRVGSSFLKKQNWNKLDPTGSINPGPIESRIMDPNGPK